MSKRRISWVAIKGSKKQKEIKDEEDPIIIQQKLKDFNEFTERFEKQETIYKSLDYWDSYLKKNHSPIIDIFFNLVK